MSQESLIAIAQKLVSYCQNNDTDAGLKELYHQDAISIEAATMPGNDSPETKGIEAIKAKHQWWAENFELHSSSTEGPFFHGETSFGIIFTFDATNKASGERENMKELGIYTVTNNKITKEEFYYSV